MSNEKWDSINADIRAAREESDKKENERILQLQREREERQAELERQRVVEEQKRFQENLNIEEKRILLDQARKAILPLLQEAQKNIEPIARAPFSAIRIFNKQDVNNFDESTDFQLLWGNLHVLTSQERNLLSQDKQPGDWSRKIQQMRNQLPKDIPDSIPLFKGQGIGIKCAARKEVWSPYQLTDKIYTYAMNPRTGYPTDWLRWFNNTDFLSWHDEQSSWKSKRHRLSDFLEDHSAIYTGISGAVVNAPNFNLTFIIGYDYWKIDFDNRISNDEVDENGRDYLGGSKQH